MPPGLQAERTAFAWRRTVVALSLSAALVAVSAFRVGQARALSVLSLLVVLLAVAAIAMVLVERRDPRLRTHPWPRLALACGAAASLALVGTASALVVASSAT